MMTFMPPRNPAIGSRAETTARILDANFGDGYSQRSGDGLNALSRELALSWPLLSKADADAIEDFFKRRRGYEAFLWTPPCEAAAVKWVCKTWSREFRASGLAALSATFQQVFDL